MTEELFEWPGLHGGRALSHLLIYWAGDEVPVCVLGRFDGDTGTGPSIAPDVLATALAERLGRDDFRLIAWSPREGEHPFAEVTLTRFNRKASPTAS